MARRSRGGGELPAAPAARPTQAGAGWLRAARARVGACDVCGCAGCAVLRRCGVLGGLSYGGGVRGGSVIRVIFTRAPRVARDAACSAPVKKSWRGMRVVGERCRPSSASHPRSARGGWRDATRPRVRGGAGGGRATHPGYTARDGAGRPRGRVAIPPPRAPPDADRAPSDRTMCRWEAIVTSRFDKDA